MTKTEFHELIAQGEDSGVEFKRDRVDGRDLAKEIVALANLKGGVVLLGVEDDGAVSGLLRPDDEHAERRTYRKVEEWVVSVCRDKIRPELIPHFTVVRDEKLDREVGVVQIDPGWTVHHLWHGNHRTYYIRVGSTSREASPEELTRLFQQRGAFRLELRPISGASFGDLDRRRLVDYFANVRGQDVPLDRPPAEWLAETEVRAREEDEAHWRALAADRERVWRDEQESTWEALLINTEMIDEGDRHPATLAGLVLFGKNPKRFLPHAKIDAVAYFGTEKDYDAMERSTLSGPILPLRGVEGTLLEPGLVEQAVDFVRRNIETVRLADGVRREERWDYPSEVVREAIVNAIVHRDYSLSGADIELSIYADRMEIVSPGRLANGVTPTRMRAGCRSARNELLKDVMRDYGYLEHMGMGVPRKIVRGMMEHNGTDPELVAGEEQFTVRLWKEPAG